MFETKNRVSFGWNERDAAVNKTIRETDYITRRHRIYNRLLIYLSNPRIRHIPTGRIFPSQSFIPTNEKQFADITAPEYEAVRDVPKNLYVELKRENKTETLFDRRIFPVVAVPSFILNALCCEALEKEFRRSEILSCGGFVLREGYLRLDLEEWLSRRGFMMPVKDERGLITALRVFRSPKDARPFILKTRSDAERVRWQ